MSSIIENIEREQMRVDIPDFKAGDTIKVHARIKEGEKERIQVFQGFVIRKRRGTTGATFRIYWELRQLSGTTTGYVDLTVTSAQLTANAHKVDIYDLTGFTGPTELGAQLALSLHRTAGDAGDVIIETYGCHVALDGIGSRTPTVK